MIFRFYRLHRDADVDGVGRRPRRPFLLPRHSGLAPPQQQQHSGERHPGLEEISALQTLERHPRREQDKVASQTRRR